MMHLRHLLVLFATASAMTMSVSGQQASASPIQSVAELLKLPPLDAMGSNVRTVELQGVVLGTSPAKTSFFLHDGTASVGVMLGSGTTCPTSGDAVRVRGRAVMYRAGTFTHTRARADEIIVEGKRPLPKATPINLTTLNTFDNFDQWVSVEAFVWVWRFTTPTLELRINSRDAWSTAKVPLGSAADLPKKLHGAKIRFTGVNGSAHSPYEALQVPGLGQMEILQEGSDDPFDMPLQPAEEVGRRHITDGSRVKVKGTVVVGNHDNTMGMVSGNIGLSCGLTAGWTKGFGKTEVPGDAGRLPELHPGDEVEVVGSAITKDQQNPILPFDLSWCHVRITGKGAVPQPRKVSLSHLSTFKEHSEWVSVEGTTNAWYWDGQRLQIALADPDGVVIQAVSNAQNMPFPTDLYGARVRLTGMTHAMFAGSTFNLQVPGPEHFQVVRKGSTDIFDAPEHTLESVANHTVPAGEPVRVRGVLIGKPEPDKLYVRGKSAAIAVLISPQWPRAAAPPQARFADGGPRSKVNVGDEVEFVGGQMPGNKDPAYAGFDFICTSYRIVGHKGIQEPITVSLSDVAKGAHDAELVRTRGRLLTMHQSPAERSEWHTTLVLESGGMQVPAVFHGLNRAAFDTLRVDDDVLVQGLVNRESAGASAPRQIVMANAADAHSLGLSADIRTRQLWTWGGGTAALVVLFGGWVVALRRSYRNSAELNLLLEHKVNERTAELETAHSNLAKALASERELGELKTRFVSMVSHEFRTPLGVTMSAVEIMRQFDERLSAEKRRELCDEIYNSTVNMAGLMEQVLLLGRVEAGKLVFRPIPVDLDEMLRKLIDEAQSATNRKCTIEWKPEGDLSGSRGDEALLRQILNNLITNGVKYSPEGAEVTIKARRENIDLVLEVVDRGIGIPEKDIEHLYEAFHRASNVGHIPGTGLGLVIVKRCVELHRGLVTVKSEVGRGTTFTVRLPMYVDAG